VALIGLGYSLWVSTATEPAATQPTLPPGLSVGAGAE